MCGIAGIYQHQPTTIASATLQKVANSLSRRGPDNQSITQHNYTTLIHARLSIIDTSTHANQPIYDNTQRYAIIFNGEVFNYQSLRNDLEEKGYQFKTHSDTEVLLNLYIHYKEACLNLLNGFFAFCIYDKQEDELFIALDRYGVKPLYYSNQPEAFYFASELKSLLYLPIPRDLDWTAIALYFQLNYIPHQHSIFSSINKLLPGHFVRIKKNKISVQQWYTLKYDSQLAEENPNSYQEQQEQLINLLDDAVRLRLMADVPLGSFLSGGIDSSVIVALATKHTQHLNTFSIGFEDNAFFDETEYANLVAQHFKTNHTVFKLKNDDLLQSLQELLEYMDEPFADSSSLLVNLLSKYTRKHVTVALSGDGGDELFAGYNKHYGEWQSRYGGYRANIIKQLLPLWQQLPKSRNTNFGNKIRQLQRFAEGMNIDKRERYWQWCSFNNTETIDKLLQNRVSSILPNLIHTRQQFTKYIHENGTINDCLRADVDLILAYDMLVKVDRMSMQNSLEVRTPFLDYRVVEFAFTLPQSSKINAYQKKRIVQDAFKFLLPKELYNRPKKGFEVPLLQWFKSDLEQYLNTEIFNEDFLREQNIFDITYIKNLQKQLYSSNPQDVHATIWALVCFQNFYKKYINI